MKTVHVAIEGGQSFCARPGERLSNLLKAAGVYLSEPCGGVGRCGKCKVLVLRGKAGVTEADRRFFDEKELAQGCRLACTLRVEDDLLLRLSAPGEDAFDVLTADAARGNAAADASFGLAIDIGTTTLAAALVDRNTGEIVASACGVNHQRAYGADVIARIAAANDGRGAALQNCIRQDLNALIGQLLSGGGFAPGQIARAAVSANTTMGHLLMGYPCEGLGAYPFTPHRLDAVSDKAAGMFGEETLLRCPVTLLPGISAFVGGDIAAGLLACGVYEQEKPVLLLDLGTNGEMAVGNRERILVTSTAAGPAFEGGNISCGIGSIPGAICNVKITGGAAKVTTIGDAPARGLCGTGVIEAMRELLVNGLVDESGLMAEEYGEAGFVLAKTQEGEPLPFTQRDVREIQLAKSAVRAGAETLLLRYGISCDEVAAVYVAGGFGTRLDIAKAVDIGLLPEKLRGKVRAVGNTSLRGAIDFLTKTAAPGQLAGLIAVSKEVALAMDQDFNERYLEYMTFERSEREG